MAPQTWQREDGYELTDDPARLDFSFVTPALQSTYWANTRPAEVIESSFRSPASIGFSLLSHGRQVGMARVVTDRATFSWLCDVYIDPAHRGRGLASWMIGCVVSHPEIAQTRMMLRTRDAQGLYARFDFAAIEAMFRRRPSDAR